MGIFKKVAAVIRVAIRRSVIPIHVRKAGVRAIVPITANADGTDDVGIDEVRIASSIPYNY